MKRISLIILLTVLLFSLLPYFAEAEEDWCNDLSPEDKTGGLVPCGRSCDDPSTPDIDESEPCTLCDFFVMIDRWIDRLLFMIIPPLAALMIAIGGFMLIFAYVSPDTILPGGGKGGPALLSQAKKLFSSVIIGLLIIYGAWLIINAFFMFIGVADWTGLRQGWWQINCQ